MSPKELLYAEDALEHMKFMNEKCTHAASQVTDASLKKLIDDVATRNKKMFDEIYNVVKHESGEA